MFWNYTNTGAFYMPEGSINGAKVINAATGDNGGYYGYFLQFDASRSNAIYGNSDTVQPPALTMQYLIKY